VALESNRDLVLRLLTECLGRDRTRHQVADIMMSHPLALQLRNLQSLVEIGVDKNTTVVFPAPLMSTIGELGTFLAREATAAQATRPSRRPNYHLRRRRTSRQRNRYPTENRSPRRPLDADAPCQRRVHVLASWAVTRPSVLVW
jgi:hypothetical protein